MQKAKIFEIVDLLGVDASFPAISSHRRLRQVPIAECTENYAEV
jgi:hypothetical protein